MSKKITDHIETAEEQRELFLWKYKDVSREDVNKMYNVSFMVLLDARRSFHLILQLFDVKKTKAIQKT